MGIKIIPTKIRSKLFFFFFFFFLGPPPMKYPPICIVSSFYGAHVCNNGIIFYWKSIWRAKVLIFCLVGNPREHPYYG